MNNYERRFNCPFCNDVKKHLYINVQKMLGLCFRCGKRLGPKEAYQFLKRHSYHNNIVETCQETVRDPYIESLIEKAVPAALLSEDQYIKIMKYINKDKIPYETAVKFGIMFHTVGVIIPLGDGHYQVRKFFGHPKYYTSKGFKKCLFNIVPGDTVTLVEGVFDAIATNSTAVFGHFLTERQAFQLIMSGARKVVIAFDGDVPKIDIVEQAKFLEQYFPCVRVKKLESGCDPYDVMEKFQEIPELTIDQFIVGG